MKHLKLWENFDSDFTLDDGSYEEIEPNLNPADRGVVVCVNTLKHKRGGLNFFDGATYNYVSLGNDTYTVAYEDGRFSTFGKDMFENNFKIVD